MLHYVNCEPQSLRKVLEEHTLTKEPFMCGEVMVSSLMWLNLGVKPCQSPAGDAPYLSVQKIIL